MSSFDMESAIIDSVSPIPDFECVASQAETTVRFTLYYQN